MGDLDEGHVVVAFRTAPWDAPGRYGLVPSSEWREDRDIVTVIRGPKLSEERVSREDLYEEECRAVQVDAQGFYTCEVVMDSLRDEVLEEAEQLFTEEANRRAAETYSYVANEEAHEKYGEETWIKATCGDAVAVGGEAVFSQKRQKPPRGYIKTDLGGYYPGGDEEELELESISEPLAWGVSKKMGRPVYPDAVLEILKKEHDKPSRRNYGYIYWNSDSIDTEIWVSKKAWKAAATAEEIAAMAREKAAEKEHQRRVRERELADAKAAEEHARKLKAGGYPGPEDWDPRGERAPHGRF
jgi:hypothetical protein